jgi:hypothetical protein
VQRSSGTQPASNIRPAWVRSAGVIALISLTGALAILNSGGYRYGASDQAFYLPAVVQHLDPSLFPRDRALLHVQDRFMLFDDLAADVARATGVSVPVLFFVLFLAGLGLCFAGYLALGRIWYRSWWSVSALMLLMTLRHRISRTGVNTLEGYLHPRMLAFAVCLWAVVAFLRGRSAIAIVLVAVAAALHTTTALWFAVWLGVAIAVAEPRWRSGLAAGAVATAVLAGWLIWFGPLGEQLVRIDEQWLAVLRIKDYLFATDWPVWAWLLNLSYPAIVWAGYRMRAARGQAHPRELALVLGALSLVVAFLVSVPLTMVPLALAVQFQVSRVFWMLEVMAAVYLVWMAVEAESATSPRRAIRRSVAVALGVIAISRGAFIMGVEQTDRRIIQIAPPDDEWTDVMTWLEGTPVDTHVVADPNHAFEYGASVRAFGKRDVFFEASKDTALAIYSREVAQRVLERIEALGDFGTLTPERARSLAAAYDLDFLVTEGTMELPVAYSNARFKVYALQSGNER